MRSFTPRAASVLRLIAVCVVVFAALAPGVQAQAQSPCPAGMRCGSVTVPLDRQNPAAGPLEVGALARGDVDAGWPGHGSWCSPPCRIPPLARC